ncbi:MAG: formate dehydrogenase subunit gamma [Xanthobacteraceae bacterium]
MTAYDIQPGDKVNPGDPVTVDRYTAGARINHWTTAICLILLAVSGLALFHPSLFFLTDLFGGGENTRAFHPWVGVVVLFAFYGLFFRFWRACLLAREDVPWLLGLPDMLAGREDKLPEVGRYNPGQKMFFWSMAFLVIVLFVTGLIIWDQYFYGYTTIEQKRIAVLIHSLAAVLAICAVIVHIYMVIWERGTLRAMTRGYVTGGWAWKHHRKWLRELVTGKPRDTGAKPAK